MASKQGDPALLEHPVAKEMLQSTNPAHLAYAWRDGTPRVVPIWFHWNGQDIVMGTPPGAPKVDVLQDGTPVALSIDGSSWPYHVLLVRGRVKAESVSGVAAEYAAAAERYFGPEQGRAWVEQVKALSPSMVRLWVRPEWVGILDFETRFPSAIEAAMAGAAPG
jgi:nitroimidazol reductase NimA-like FMN-containing flavoprotein (pyridoxamine 5'-phosphate oxidase superfamily)